MPQLQLNWRDLAFATLIVLFAFTLRVIVVFDRAWNDDIAFELVSGVDQTAYYIEAQELLAGTWPDAAFFRHPGPSFYLGFVQFLVGDGIGIMRLVTSLTGALTCGVIIMAGWMLTGRKWGGFIAGIVLAIYPVAIFYSTDFLAEPVAAAFMCLYLLFTFMSHNRLTWWASILAGLMVGFATTSRLALLIMLLPLWVYLWNIAETRGAFLKHALLAVVGFWMIIGVVFTWNVSHNRLGLVTNRHGWTEIYLSNNRDANGRWEGNVAEKINNFPEREALFRDIANYPWRFFELQVHKFGVYWSAIEPGNNINFIFSGQESSVLLRSIPFDFRMLGILGLLGLIPIFYTDRKAFWFFLCAHFLMSFSTSALVMEGRMRWAHIPVLALSSAPFFLAAYDTVQAKDWGKASRRYAVPVILVLVFTLVGEWTVQTLPRNQPYANLPDDVRPLNVIYDDKLELVGWRPLPDWQGGITGWVQHDEHYAVELFWRVLEDVDVDYQYHITQVLDDAGFDRTARPIGSISFQFKLTSEWRPGEIYGEISGFGIETDMPAEISTRMIAGAFLVDENDESREAIPLSSSVDGQVILQHVALFDYDNLPEPRADLSPMELNYADLIALRGMKFPENAATGEDIQVSLHWEALGNITTDYTLFVHIADADGEVITSYDGMPRGGQLLTSTWAPDYPIYDDITLTMPDAAGTYDVYIGWYNVLDGTRLPVEAPDNRPLVGQINVSDE